MGNHAPTGTNNGRVSSLPDNIAIDGPPVAPAGPSQKSRANAPPADSGPSNNHAGAQFSQQSINRPGVGFRHDINRPGVGFQHRNHGNPLAGPALASNPMNGKPSEQPRSQHIKSARLTMIM